MEDQLTIDTGEITTSPGLISQNYTDREKSLAKPATRRKNGFFASLWPLMQAYGASLAAGYAIVPSIATIFTVVFYLVASNVPGWQLVATYLCQSGQPTQLRTTRKPIEQIRVPFVYHTNHYS